MILILNFNILVKHYLEIGHILKIAYKGDNSKFPPISVKQETN